MQFRPLNPTLYTALQAKFGHVEVVAPGVRISWRAYQDWRSDPGSTPKRRVNESGEEYKCACPFCGDWRLRLFINHRWGVYDSETKSRNLWLAQCFNESCLSDYQRQKQLYLMVFGRQGAPRSIVINPGKPATKPEDVKAELPGPCIRIDELARTQPKHRAIRYLQSRHFDPMKLGPLYGVLYCQESKYGLASDRIIIPVYEHGVLRGWQARHIGDDVHGVPLKELGIPKYWTMPMMPRKTIGYNLDRAVQHQTIVVVEGPADTWGFGPQSFALLSKTISPLLVAKLQHWIDRYWGHRAVIVVMLDPDQDSVSARKGSPHHIEIAAKVLRDNLRSELRDRVVPLYLPAGSDPGSLDRGFMRDVIQQAAEKAGHTVCFSQAGRKLPLPAMLPQQNVSST
jgi:hypothetical protein